MFGKKLDTKKPLRLIGTTEVLEYHGKIDSNTWLMKSGDKKIHSYDPKDLENVPPKVPRFFTFECRVVDFGDGDIQLVTHKAEVTAPVVACKKVTFAEGEGVKLWTTGKTD